MSKKNNFSGKFYSNIFDSLFKLNRSIMGKGYNDSIKILNKYFNFKFYKFPTGKKIFDWTIPKEWNVKEAYILTPDKKKIF